MADHTSKIQQSLKGLFQGALRDAATNLFAAMGYASRKTISLDGSPQSFLSAVDPDGLLANKVDAQVQSWKQVEFLFQLTNDELPRLAMGHRELNEDKQDYLRGNIDSFVFLAVELDGEDWSRRELTGITREINCLLPMPVVVLFRYNGLASLAVIDRRPNKRDFSRDVIEKNRISIIKDINLSSPHRAHLDILEGMALPLVKVKGKGTPTNFRALYDGWLDALSIQALNEKFYKELANWFFWSTGLVIFPAAVVETTQDEKDKQNQIALIRLLTRLIFVWFIKEKGLVPERLFDPVSLRSLLKVDPINDPESSTYYKAILQNLFFATLNTEMSQDRNWRTKGSGGSQDGHYLIHSVYRFADQFQNSDEAIELFRKIPFLNGGLFECLDRKITDDDLSRNPGLVTRCKTEGKGKSNVIRIDGFSERPDNPLCVPNRIFFATDETVELNKFYDTKGKTYKASGLIEIFSRYKFTVEESTPIEEEVALDPELLGKVFENLLASYNEDTKTSARKKSGSFYTPRVVVDYMVDEALIAYFEPRLAALVPEVGLRPKKPVSGLLDLGPAEGELDIGQPPPSEGAKPRSDNVRRLHELLSYGATSNPFSPLETDALIAAINDLKALDPACGSGAFPMGLLQKLIHILHRLDPDNARWKAQNRKPLADSLTAAKATVDPSQREVRIDEAEQALEKLESDFSDANRPDYARKLYLIDKCLFGVDKQPIAVQIAKLRFFISLVVSQKIDRSRPNANITPLPNLETKLVAANSLMPIQRADHDDLLRNDSIKKIETEIRAVNERYFSARTVKTKSKHRQTIGRLRDELGALLRAGSDLPENDARKMAAWDPFDQNEAADFFDPEWMFAFDQKQKFDLVIGNPPYVRQESIKDQKADLEKFYKGAKKDNNGWYYGSYVGTADLLVYFIQRGIELLNPGGAFAFITSNKWYRAKYGERLRGWLNNQARIKIIIDFGDAEVFDAIAYPTIIIANRRNRPEQQPTANDILQVLNWPQNMGREAIEGFPQMFEDQSFVVPQKELTSGGWQLEPQFKRGLLDRIRSAGTPLKDLLGSRVFRGVTTGFNEAFVIETLTRDKLISKHISSAEIIKPYVRGADVERWHAVHKDLWLIFTRRGIDINAYPAILNHLEQYREKLTPKPTDWDDNRDGAWPGRKAGSYQWFEIQDNVAYWKEFEEKKIISTKISFRPTFCVDTSGFYPANTSYCIPSGSMSEYLVGILNSNVYDYYAKNIFLGKQGGFYEVQPDGLEEFPVPKATVSQLTLVETLVKIILTSTHSRFEQLLNGFVYELFFTQELHDRGLTLFAESAKAGLSNLSNLDGTALQSAAEDFAAIVFATSHPLYAMLFDLQALDVVRIIEGKD